MDYVFLQEQIIPLMQANIAINDRGFLLGDGIFETVKIHQGQAIFLQEHLLRLQQSAESINMPLRYPLEFLQARIKTLITKNNLLGKDAVLRITLTRGAGPRGLNPSKDCVPTLLMATHPFTAFAQEPLAVLGTQFRKNELSKLSQLKTLNYLENILARQEAVAAGYGEALLLNSKEQVASASAANVFWVLQGKLFTPAVADGALPGITRAVVMRLAEAAGISVIERSFCYEAMVNMDECFLSNSLLGIQRVSKLDHKTFASSAPITQQLQFLYQQQLQNLSKRHI